MSSTQLADEWKNSYKDKFADIDDPATEADVALEFVDHLAEAAHQGDVSGAMIDTFLTQLADRTSIKKRTLEDEFEDRRDALEADDDDDDGVGDTVPIDTFLEDSVRKVIKYDPTDASADARYIWELGGGKTVETTREHLATNSFAHELYDATDCVVDSSTSDDLNTSWTLYIKSFINEHKEVREIKGDRTLAVEDLRRKLERAGVTDDKETAATAGQAWLRDEESDIVWVSSKVIQLVLADRDKVDLRDLQVELDARRARAGRNVEQYSIANSTIRFWPLSRDFADFSGGETDD